MRSSERQAPRHGPLITLNRLTAGACLAAALLLLTGVPPLDVPGLSDAPWHEPVIVHLLLSAVMMFWNAAQLVQAAAARHKEVTPIQLLGGAVSGAFAVVEFTLAGMAVFHTAPWALLFMLPCIAHFLSFFALAAGPNRERGRAGTPALTDQERVLLAVEQSRRHMALLHTGGLAFLAASLATLAIGFLTTFWSGLVNDAVFNQRFPGWAAFARSVEADLEAYSLAGGVVAAGLAAGAGWLALSLWLDARRNTVAPRDIHRRLREDELAFIGEASRQFNAYARATASPSVSSVGIFFWAAFAVAATWLIIGYVARGGAGFGARTLEAQRTDGLDWALYLDALGTGDALLPVCAILLGMCALLALGLLWRRPANTAILSMFRFRMDTDDPWPTYRVAIAAEVRRGTLGPRTGFDPASWVHAGYRRFTLRFGGFTVLLCAVSLALLYLDRMDYDLLTEDRIETVDYWTTEVHRFAYDEVQGVTVTCIYDGDFDFHLAYVLALPEGRTIDVIGPGREAALRRVLPERLPAWERADAKLRAAGAPVRHAAEAGGTVPGFDARKCARELGYLVDGNLLDRILSLLRESGAGAASS